MIVKKLAEEPSRKAYLPAWAQITSCHGIIDLYDTYHLPLRVFWALLLAFSFGVATWQISEALKEFVKEPHYVTKSYLKDDELVEFPNVTICNFNRVKKSVAESFNMSSDALAYLFSSIDGSYEIDDTEIGVSENYGIDSKLEAWKQWHGSLPDQFQQWTIKDWLMQLGYSCKDMLVRCNWEGSNFDCCNEDVAKPVVTEYGKCWSISVPSWNYKYGLNARQPRVRQLTAGAMGGLKLMLDPQLSEYTYDVIVNNYFQRGFVININYDPYAFAVQNPLAVSPSKYYWVSMTKTVKFVADPAIEIFTKPCIDGKVGQLAHLKAEYSTTNCDYDCQQEYLLKNCSCYSLAELIDDSVPICNGTILRTCHLGLDNYIKRITDAGFQTCSSSCYDPCEDQRSVQFLSTSAEYAPDIMRNLAKFLISKGYPVTDEEILMSSIVNIFFSSMSHTVMEKHEKTPVFELMGTVGGQLGLWLGISIVTVVQFFYYIIAALCKIPVGKLETQK